MLFTRLILLSNARCLTRIVTVFFWCKIWLLDNCKIEDIWVAWRASRSKTCGLPSIVAMYLNVAFIFSVHQFSTGSVSVHSISYSLFFYYTWFKCYSMSTMQRKLICSSSVGGIFCGLSLITSFGIRLTTKDVTGLFIGGEGPEPQVKWSAAINAAFLSFLNGFAFARNFFPGIIGGPRSRVNPLVTPLLAIDSWLVDRRLRYAGTNCWRCRIVGSCLPMYAIWLNVCECVDSR